MLNGKGKFSYLLGSECDRSTVQNIEIMKKSLNPTNAKHINDPNTGKVDLKTPKLLPHVLN